MTLPARQGSPRKPQVPDRIGPRLPSLSLLQLLILLVGIAAIILIWIATLQRANIRIDALYQYLPPRIAALADWLALVVLSVFIVYWTRYAATVAGLSWDNQSTANTTFATPLWIPQTLWVAGLLWLCVVLGLMLLRSTIALVTGDLRTVRDICGVRSTKEEADAEAEAGKRLVQGDAS